MPSPISGAAAVASDTLTHLIASRLGLTTPASAVQVMSRLQIDSPRAAALASGRDVVFTLSEVLRALQEVGLAPEQVRISSGIKVEVAQASFGSRLKSLRTKAGLTQAELAEKIGVGYKTVDQWESGRRTPSVKVAADVAAALGTDLTAFADCVYTTDTPESAT